MTTLLPNALQFQELLHNPTFVDFLNTFLNLPAFPCRLFYRKSLESFEVDSVAFHSDMHSLTFEQERLMGWLLDSRVAFYYKTELYRECTLAMRLSAPHQSGDTVGEASPSPFLLCTTSTCLVAQFGDSVRNEMSTIAGLKTFKAFLRGTPGEHLVGLYLDVMKVYLCQDQFKQQRLIQKISGRYLWSKSNRSLPPDVRQLLQVSIHRSTKLANSRWRAGEINAALDEIIKATVCRLQCYWYRRYLVHRAVIKCHTKSKDTLQLLCDVCRSVLLVSDKSMTKLASFVSRDVKNCDCCAITCLISNAGVHNCRDNQTASSPSDDSRAAGLSECKEHVTVMGSFDCSMNLSRALLQDVTSGAWTQEARALTAALISDQYAGSPFGCYLQQRSKTIVSNCLLLWREALDLIQSWGQPQTTWDEKIQQFLTTFVESESEFDCELPGLLIQQMESLLPLGHGKECLVQAQEHVLKSLRLQWSKYAARDLECFWTNVNSTSRSATHKLLARRSPLRRTTSKSPLADSTRPAIISGLSASSYRCWRSLVLVRPQWDRGLCELHGVSGVTSCGSVTSLGSRRGPVMLTTDQLEHVRLRLEEERLRKLRESRIIRVKKITEEVVEAKPSVQLDAGVAINQLTRPKKFHQVLLNLDYREHFRCFLTMQEAEIPLQFWVAVYEMKRQCRTHTEAQETARQIKRRFFSKAMRKGAALQCKEKLITDIGAAEDVSPADLFTAASLVAQSLKKQWFSYYRNTLPPAEGDDEEDEEVIDVKAVMIATRPQLTRQRKTRYLWTTCIKRICHFRRGLSSKITRRAFKRYLNLQKFMPDGQRKPEYAMRKIMKNSQLISISRLTYDLDFWVEVDKYKQMADEAGMPWGEQTREEEAFIQRKAFAVINCFLDSVVPPKIQVNVSTEVVNKIVDNAACGTIKRSIFHAASMQIFNVLAHYWKRFCCHRAGLEAEVEKRRPSQRPSILFRQQPRKTDGSQTSGSSNKSKKEQTAAGDDDVMCISFSITTGIQLERHRFSHITNEATAAQS